MNSASKSKSIRKKNEHKRKKTEQGNKIKRISKKKRAGNSHITKLETKKNQKKVLEEASTYGLQYIREKINLISGNHDAKQKMRLEKKNKKK
jgi:hypothetical protein